MAYTFKFSDTYSITVNASQTDSAGSPLVLSGGPDPAMDYGNAYENNMIHILEHFYGPTVPIKPSIGMIWFNTTTDMVLMYATDNLWYEIKRMLSLPNSTPVPRSAPGPNSTPDNQATGKPHITASPDSSGYASAGTVLNGSLGTITDMDGINSNSISYEWWRSDMSTPLSIGPTYVVQSSDLVNATIILKVSFMDNLGYSTSVVSDNSVNLRPPTGNYRQY